MIQKAKQYLEKNLPKERDCLLGLSGGPDSMALFYLLYEGGWKFRVCHIDHAWREESSKEAEILKKRVEDLGIPFHLFRVEDVTKEETNLEDKYRQKRLLEFQKIYQEFGCSALLLGHQREDQTETVIKRLFESSGLSHLMGMEVVSTMRGMKVVRPFLETSKKELILWLEGKNIPFFTDSTNQNTKYLRARMRHEMIPLLEKSFGKGICESIAHFSGEMRRVNELLNKTVEPLFDLIEKGPLGSWVPISSSFLEIQLTHFLRNLFERLEILPLREEIERLMGIIKEKKDGKGLVKGKFEIMYDRHRLFFFLRDSVPKFQIMNGEGPTLDWQKVWGGETKIYMPEKEAILKLPCPTDRLSNGVLLKKWYSQNQVPIILRDQIPAAYVDGLVVREFLTGRFWSNQVLTLMKEKNRI